MFGNLAAQVAALSHAEADILCPVTAQPNGRLTSGRLFSESGGRVSCFR